jgi:hypothetical protein
LIWRVVAVDSSYSQPSAEGDVFIPYRLSDDWLFVYSILEYEGVSAKRRAERLAADPLDARVVLYGRALLEFIAGKLFAARNSDDEELFTEIHAKWLMSAREVLRGQMPREILLAKQDFIDFDLHSRSLQWSFTGACPPPVPRSSNACTCAGFGTQEMVVYYEFVRCLMEGCLARAARRKRVFLERCGRAFRAASGCMA